MNSFALNKDFFLSLWHNLLSYCNSWFLAPLNIPKVCLNSVVENSENRTQSKPHSIEDNQEQFSLAGGLTIDLSEQSVISDLSAVFIIMCNVICRRVKWRIFLSPKIVYVFMRSRLKAHSPDLVVSEWCPKLLRSFYHLWRCGKFCLPTKRTQMDYESFSACHHELLYPWRLELLDASLILYYYFCSLCCFQICSILILQYVIAHLQHIVLGMLDTKKAIKNSYFKMA